MANPNHDERGRFGSSGSGGGSARSRLTGDARRRMDEAVAHREMVARSQEPRRTSDARGTDQPTSYQGRITSRQTRTDPPRRERGTSGRGRTFFG